MFLTTTCCYGLQAMFYIAEHSDKNTIVDVQEIAISKHLPAHFLSKILNQLVKKELLLSYKGQGGGYRLRKNASEISILDVINALDGNVLFEKCGLLFQDCSTDHSCPIHDSFRQEMNVMESLFTTKKLSDNDMMQMAKSCSPCSAGAESEKTVFNDSL